MKYILLVCLLFPVICYSQDDGLFFELIEVVEIKDVTKDDLYDRAFEYINNTFVSSKKVIQSADRDAGTIYAKALFRKSEFDAIYFSMNIAVKDGKYKYEITDLYHEGHGGGYSNVARVEKVGGVLSDESPDCKMPGKHWKKLQEYGAAEIIKMSNSFKAAMSEKAFSDF